MANYEFVTVDVFTDQRFGGNPLAVFPAAEGLSAATMQALAREFNLSETAFVFPPQDRAHTARVRIFTPGTEVPFAGHPNVGTGFVLGTRHPGAGVLTFEEAAGVVAVRLARGARESVTGAEIAAPQPLALGEEVAPALVAACVGLTAEDIVSTSHPPLIAGVGLPFVFVELASLEALRRAVPEVAAFRRAAARHAQTPHFAIHLYVRDAKEPRRLASRMFGPLIGVAEDPATGSANAALAALLTSLATPPARELTFDITQGVEMGRPSRLFATARREESGAITAAVGGSCVPVMEGRIEL
jgi:trans-2,3-dihydro-3-hydroxyanthranilate isomerase